MRRVLGAGRHYLQRLGRWVVILVQLRGASWRDQLKLLGSAAAAPVTSLNGLTRWQDPVMLYDADIVVRGIGRFHVRRRSDDLWHLLPWREQGVHRTLKQLLRRGDRFIDAGANIGIYTVLASRLVGPAGRVVAIEMMPDTAAILRRHVEDNGCANVEIIERALSDRPGEKVTARVPVGKYGQASIAQAGSGDRQFEEREVETVTLDGVCGGIDQIRLMKLDLEGAELKALAGGGSALERTETLIYESHTDSDALAEAIREAGFDVAQSLGKDRVAERHPPSAP